MRSASSILRPTRGATTLGSHLSRHKHTSVSAKLFADAEAEEREEAQKSSKSSQVELLMNKQENWDGDERIQDTVLRMLVDKYKPLRTGQIQTADEKIKARVPQISTKPIAQQNDWETLESTITHGGTFTEPVSDETEKTESPNEPLPPWLVTFKVPSHAQASIKLGNFASSPPRAVTASSDPFSTRSRAERKAEKRFAEGAGRLDRARESTLDYQSGAHGRDGGGRMRPNPVSMRGWNSMIEERIQHAQATGAFNKIEGRGKPLQRTADEMNPFVAREEFLMNRIVRKNDAAPPWVELQKDTEKATLQMRELLVSGWTRRAVRMLPLTNSTAALDKLTPEAASRLRDTEWEQQESKYHSTIIREVNDAIRRYNTVAPYVVRRPLLTLESELAKCYDAAGALIVAGIHARMADGHLQSAGDKPRPSDHTGNSGWEALRNAVKRLYARFSNVAGHMYH